MNFSEILRRFVQPTAFILALLVAVTCLGCTSSDVGDILDLAVDVLEVLEDTPADDTVGDSQDDTTEDKPTETSAGSPVETKAPDSAANNTKEIDEKGSYYSKDDVSLYIHTYGKLPDNFITKSEAEKLGWEGGSVEQYAKGCVIGGDTFGNREGILPKKSGRVYTECDIDTLGESSRGAKRIVFSNDGLIYYTDDHYETFTLLYGEE